MAEIAERYPKQEREEHTRNWWTSGGEYLRNYPNRTYSAAIKNNEA
ncbi:MAG: hypothetical protein ACLTLQ_03465 [[Clostridium] scindens]